MGLLLSKTPWRLLETPSLESLILEVALRDPACSNNRYPRLRTRAGPIFLAKVYLRQIEGSSGREDHGDRLGCARNLFPRGSARMIDDQR